MAISASGLYVTTWTDILDTTQLAVDFDAENHKIALYTNSITPNFSTDTGYSSSPYTSGEASGAGYTAGGQALTGTALSESPTRTIKWAADNMQWTSSTITAKGALIYANALTGKNCILLVNFGSDFSTVSGTFLITWSASGIFTLSL
ncbi:hypothetical protein [Microbispora sp. ATCC PTA-5024]|uniref:hypothetical protein n=1 Tax=Microbispora sp. ATCC PTA-5024 TaxID=316330 RepID=UPI0003DCE847|nr:hypothetical protein [Microbispora sp. ATCC PTA-5024]ETK36118.1 hypothetical protein MPTA5024_10865 [Microbispora sp. ATCC PTA-5024]